MAKASGTMALGKFHNSFLPEEPAGEVAALLEHVNFCGWGGGGVIKIKCNLSRH